MRILRLVFAFGAVLILHPGLSAAQYVDVWHHHGPDDSFYFEGRETLTLFQENRSYAKVYLTHGADHPEAMVSFEADDYSRILFSILIMNDGTAKTRVISSADFSVTGMEDDSGFVKYVFALPPADLVLMENAETWRIHAAGKVIEFPLIELKSALATGNPIWKATLGSGVPDE